jgi:hypothetical protein
MYAEGGMWPATSSAESNEELKKERCEKTNSYKYLKYIIILIISDITSPHKNLDRRCLQESG